MIANEEFNMKIRLIVSTFLSILLILSICLSASQTDKRMILKGSETPELIPIFPAWQMFISTLDQSYQYNVLDSYLAKTVKLSQIGGYLPIKESVVALIADFASYSQREFTKISNKENDLRELHIRGVLTHSELSTQYLSNVAEQVTFLAQACEMLRNSLVKLDEQVGSAIWNQLVVFCKTHVREGMSFTSEGTAEDLAVQAIWKRFDPKPISVQRK